MRILIENPSSAGSSLTRNTIETLKIAFSFCEEHPFSVFDLQTIIVNAGFKWKNARTIFPLMRYLNFVSYEKYTNLSTDSFFTDRGRAYMNSILLDEDGKCTPEVKKNLARVRESLVKGGLNSLLLDESCSYQWIIKRTLEFLLQYQKIDKKEFAYLVYAEGRGITLQSEEFSNAIESYRERTTSFDVVVVIRNDQDKKSETKEVDDRYLTSYGYVTNILIQSGIIEKDDDYCILNGKNREDVSEILRGRYDEKSR